MSAMVINQAAGATMIEGAIPIPFIVPDSFPSFTLPITAPGFHYELDAPLVERPRIEDDRLTVRFTIDPHVEFTLTLTGSLLDDRTQFQASHFLLHCKVTKQAARPHFVAATVLAVFGFAGKIGLTIPDSGVGSYLDFNPPLLELSNFLQRRQLAYRLMTVERAAGVEFRWPEVCTYEELGSLHRTFLAITERAFRGPIDPIARTIPAKKESIVWLDSIIASPKQVYGQQKFDVSLFGRTIDLGTGRLIVDDVYILDADKVRHELEADDGHLVVVVISSLSGQGLYETPQAPHFPDSWEPKIKALIALEPSLDDSLVGRYHALATATLAGADEEQRRSMTARPELGEGAFLPRS